MAIPARGCDVCPVGVTDEPAPPGATGEERALYFGDLAPTVAGDPLLLVRPDVEGGSLRTGGAVDGRPDPE